MTSETEVVATAVATSVALLPPIVQEIANLAGSLATVAAAFGAVWIPIILYRNDRKRATLDLIRYLATDPALHERTNRLFQFRMHRAKAAGAKGPYRPDGPENPIHDCLIVLNAFDAACIELKFGAVYEDMLFETLRDTIIASTALIDELNELVGSDRSDGFPHLLATIPRWVERANREGINIAPPISPDRPSESEHRPPATPGPVPPPSG